MSWLGELMVNAHNWWSGTAKVKAALQKDPNPLRIGVLAAASINYVAIIDPIQTHPGAVLVGIAARSEPKAVAQINKYKLSSTCKAYGSYESLLADPAIDAVYIPTPNGLHAEWAIKAMNAGKHVLVEKPIASNANEVRQIRETAQNTGKVALEAFHWRFHPAAHLCKEIVESGKYGSVTGARTRLNFTQGIIGKDDIRFDYALGGGACMDLTYVFSTTSYFASPDPLRSDVRVLEATARLSKKDPRVDEAMVAKFVVDSAGKPPATCEVDGDLRMPLAFGFIPQLWRMMMATEIHLEKADVVFDNFLAPHMNHAITIKEKDSKGKLTGKQSVERCYVDGPQWGTRGKPWWTTYRWQLEAFVDMVRAKEQGTEYRGPSMSLEESEKLMETIDKVYEKAGLPKRGL